MTNHWGFKKRLHNRGAHKVGFHCMYTTEGFLHVIGGTCRFMGIFDEELIWHNQTFHRTKFTPFFLLLGIRITCLRLYFLGKHFIN